MESKDNHLTKQPCNKQWQQQQQRTNKKKPKTKQYKTTTIAATTKEIEQQLRVSRKLKCFCCFCEQPCWHFVIARDRFLYSILCVTCNCYRSADDWRKHYGEGYWTRKWCQGIFSMLIKKIVSLKWMHRIWFGNRVKSNIFGCQYFKCNYFL